MILKSFLIAASYMDVFPSLPAGVDKWVPTCCWCLDFCLCERLPILQFTVTDVVCKSSTVRKVRGTFRVFNHMKTAKLVSAIACVCVRDITEPLWFKVTTLYRASEKLDRVWLKIRPCVWKDMTISMHVCEWAFCSLTYTFSIVTWCWNRRYKYQQYKSLLVEFLQHTSACFFFTSHQNIDKILILVSCYTQTL